MTAGALLAQALGSALANLLLLVVVPLAAYLAYHRVRHRRRPAEAFARAGLQLGERRYLGIAAVAAAGLLAAVLAFPPPLEGSTAEGSAFAPFAGLGLGPVAVLMALLYGVVQTGFAEEFLFRGLVAGSLGRRLPLAWANLLQALLFLAPHALVVLVIPSAWTVLPLVFAGALFAGWLRIRSGSLLGPWLLHAAANVGVALGVAARSSG